MEFHEKANAIHEKIDELMVNVNKARDELNMARQERESWITDHNKSVKAEMKTGAESDEVADMLVQSLLSDGEMLAVLAERTTPRNPSAVAYPRRRKTCAAWVPFADAEVVRCWASSWPVARAAG